MKKIIFLITILIGFVSCELFYADITSFLKESSNKESEKVEEETKDENTEDRDDKSIFIVPDGVVYNKDEKEITVEKLPEDLESLKDFFDKISRDFYIIIDTNGNETTGTELKDILESLGFNVELD